MKEVGECRRCLKERPLLVLQIGEYLEPGLVEEHEEWNLCEECTKAVTSFLRAGVPQ